MIIIYDAWRKKQIPKNAGRWIGLNSGKFEKAFFFHSNFSKIFITKEERQLRRLGISTPDKKYKYQWFLWFNFYLIHFWKDNCNLFFGLSLGKRHYSIHFHQ